MITVRPVVSSKELQILTILKHRAKDFVEVVDIAKRARIAHSETSELLFKLARKNLVASCGNGYQITKPGIAIL